MTQTIRITKISIGSDIKDTNVFALTYTQDGEEKRTQPGFVTAGQIRTGKAVVVIPVGITELTATCQSGLCAGNTSPISIDPIDGATPTPTPTSSPVPVTPTPTPTPTLTPSPEYNIFPAAYFQVQANSSIPGNNPAEETVTPVINVYNGPVTVRVKLTLPSFNLSENNQGNATLAINLGNGVGTQTVTTDIQNNADGTTTYYSTETITIPPGLAKPVTLTAWSRIGGGPTSSYAIASIEQV